MTAFPLTASRCDAEPEDTGPGMLASRGFWIGGALSAGLWTLLLLAVHA